MNNLLPNITLITGGQRSGKSVYAEKMALSLSPNPVYIATSRIWDEEHKQRIEVHKQRRQHSWDNIEVEKYLSHVDVNNKVVLIDCVTLWATNFFFDDNASVPTALEKLKKEFDSFTKQKAHFIFVTNEIGLGEMSQSKVQRQFTDLLGWFNQYIASRANQVFLCVSGIPIKIK